MHSAIDIDDVSCSSFDLPIVASWRSIIKGYSLFCSLAVCKMAAPGKQYCHKAATSVLVGRAPQLFGVVALAR